MSNRPSLHALLDSVLDRAVQIATGTLGATSPATARTGQRQLAHEVLDALIDRRHLASEAPTGSGKSFAAGVPAMLLAADRQERTVISTESLGLQAQLIEKDLPVIASAIQTVLGVAPTFSVLKGWSNYVCTLAACGTAEAELGLTTMGLPTPDPEVLLAELREDSSDRPRTALSWLVEWAIEQVVSGNSGDRASLRPEEFGGDISEVTSEMWANVSTSPSECPSVDRCPFGSLCLPHAARATVAQSSVVVTNHSMLAIQAATAAPVVVGNKTIGPIDHLIVDEAHGLASTVRSQGASAISALGLHDILRSVERTLERPAKAKRLRAAGMDLFRQFDGELAAFVTAGQQRGRAGRRPAVAALPADSDPFDELMMSLSAWLKEARDLIPSPYATAVMSEMRSRFAAHARIATVAGIIAAIRDSPEEYARWVEQGRTLAHMPTGLETVVGMALRVSPVNVSSMLRSALYEYQETPGPRRGGPSAVGSVSPGDSWKPVVMSVIGLSATLPQSVVYEMGVEAVLVKYPSPFTAAYRNSMLYVPKLGTAELASLTGAAPQRGGKPRFDTARHPAWAAPYIARLVQANGGSALVLAATTAAGQFYVDHLAAHCPGIQVYSQWDGNPIRQTVTRWQADVRSVLVGTRSLMTGVDAPGDTCSLVVIDRVPRAAGNPVDDARVARIAERMEIDRWAADRMVYVSDAALLMEQAAGRLIRSSTDAGMVACLDPRLLKSSPIRYPETTRRALIGVFDMFDRKVSSLDAAVEFLARRSMAGAA